MVGDFRGLVPAFARAGDELCNIAGPGCPFTLPIAGRPLIAHAIKTLCDAGATEVLVATDAELADDVTAAIAESPIPAHLALVTDGRPKTLLRAVTKVLGDGPLLVHEGDALVAEPLTSDGDVRFASGERVLGYSLSTLPSDGVAPPPQSVEVEGWRYDGTVDGILDANTIALDHLKRGRIGADLSTTSVQGRVQIDPTARLDGAKLRGPVYIGPGAVISETYVGPYTTIGAGVILEGVEIEHSIVLPGAQIRYPGRRLEASLVGEGAQIGRDYQLPSALRLRVGPGADIQLS